MKTPNQYRIGSAIKYGVTTNNPIVKAYSLYESPDSYGNCGAFLLPLDGAKTGFYYFALAADGEGWEHVSVSVIGQSRCPLWEEMCYIKSLFWDEEEAVMQLHPPRSQWVNNSPFCLHLWRPIGIQVPLPPSILVGLKSRNIEHNNTGKK